MFKFRKKSVIKVTFDPYHNLPMMKAKNCSQEQLLDAALFMKGHAQLDKYKARPAKRKAHRRRKESQLHKIFRFLRAVVFRDGTPTVEERSRRSAVNCRHSFHPLYPDVLKDEPAALPMKV